MTTVTYRGGQLDGAVAWIPGFARVAVTPGARSHYVIDGTVAWYCGTGEEGAEMAEISRAELDRDRQMRDLAAELAKPRGCRCGRTFADAASFQVHRDPRQGCLPDGAYGQLEQIDGVWALAGNRQT